MHSAQLAAPQSSGSITEAGDALRSGWYADQNKLDPASVGSSAFGRRFSTTLPLSNQDQVFAQPLVLNGKVLIVSENNNLYTLDGETGAVLASRALGNPFHASDVQCGDLKPNIGITGTPVIDAATQTAYFFAKSYVPGTTTTMWNAHAVDVSTLAERSGFPVQVQGTAANDPSITFDPLVQMQRPGLLLLDGVVYAGFGAHCDHGNYHGWIVGVSTSGQLKTLFATEAGPHKAHGAGIWQSGGGLVSDGAGRIFFMTGNGYSGYLSNFAGSIAGTNPPPTLDEAIVRVDVQADGSLKADDFFTPSNVKDLDNQDQDFGSGGPLALPEQFFGTAATPKLIVTIGKDGTLFLHDRDHLGGFRMGEGNGDDVVNRVTADNGAWSRPSAWPGDGGWVYVTTNSKPLHAFKYGVDGGGKPALSLVGRSADNFGYTSGSPIVTSNGTQSGSALVWVISTTGPYGTGQLRAYDPVPDSSGTLTLRYEDTIGTQAKFSEPGVGNSRIYVATADGHVIGYGVPTTAPLTGAPVDFGSVVQGASATLTATATANQTVTVTAISSSSPTFTVGSVTLPVTVQAGQTLSVPVTFTPTAVGGFAATLDFTTSAGAANLSLKGRGQSATGQLTLAPAALSFGGLAVGTTKSANVTLGNSGASALTINSVTPPSAPYTVSGSPAAGQTLAPGGSITVAVQFAPTAVGSFPDKLVVASTGGTVTLPISGSAAGPGHMQLSTTTVAFGEVGLGSTATLTFTVSNSGGSDLTITKSKPPFTNGFNAVSTIPEGTVIAAGQSLTQTVTFTPSGAGAVSDAWTITANDGQGAQTVSVTGTGVSDPSDGNGLYADYFSGANFDDWLFSRLDPNIDFVWTNAPPDPSIPANQPYTVRWSGQIKPRFSETYTFTINVDDGARLWIDNQLVIDAWGDHSPTSFSGTIALQAATKYDIKVEYYENGGGEAVAHLSWQSSSQASEIVPTGRLYTDAFTFANGFSSVSTLQLNGAAALVGNSLRLTNAAGQAASVFTKVAHPIGRFQTEFTFVLANAQADGLTFTLQAVGPQALGPSGGGLGYGPDRRSGTGGIAKSVAVKFDLYSNEGEGGNSTGLYSGGVAPTQPSVALDNGIDLHSGHPFHVTMSYDGTTLAVTVRDTTTQKASTHSYTVNIPGLIGAGNAYVGFTAGTGGLFATQSIERWTFAAN